MRSFKISALAVAFACFAATASWANYTDKSVHDPGDTHEYKHPNQKSFTSPFDYAPTVTTERLAPKPRVEKTPAGRCNQFTFDATKSYDVDKDKLSVMWDFGDGQTSDKPVVNHVYEQAGEYRVTLTVRDSSGQVCDSGIATTTVNANFPPTAVAGEDMTACLGGPVSFDASRSTSSGPATYTWDFGDGETATGQTISHTYQKPGNYRARVTVDDGKNTECSVAQDTVNVSIMDRAGVALQGTESLCVGQTAKFNANGTGGVSRYTWDFGDGSTWEGGSNASHRYEKSGRYTVRVTGDNGKGNDCSAASDSVAVTVNAAPIANAGENVACCVGKDTTFDGSKSTHPDGKALNYHWDFGDGQRAEGERVNHVYEKSGDYRVVLTVKDETGSDCDSSSDSFMAHVNTQPEAIIQVR
jgi:large repetitive protein